MWSKGNIITWNYVHIEPNNLHLASTFRARKKKNLALGLHLIYEMEVETSGLKTEASI